MTLKSGTSQACAACKYQRKKCTQDCQLAPYFPADKPRIFSNAHKLFGVSNILKILKHLNPNQKPEAMRSIIFQSDMREKYPVLGCVAVIQNYIYQIRQCEEEVNIVNSLLAFVHQQQQHQIQPNSLDHQLQLGMAPFHSASSPPNLAPAPFANPYGNSENLSYTSCCSNGYNSAYVELNENVAVTTNPPVWIQQANNNNHDDYNSPENKSLIPPPMAEEVFLKYDEMNPYFDPNIFDKQSHVASKKDYDSSPESSMTDAMQSVEHITENELKTPAACFTLTSVN